MTAEILVIGAESTGKSSLIKRIREISSLQSHGNDFDTMNSNEVITPTIGVDIVDINYFSTLFKLRELGVAISSRWHSYYEDCDAMIFLVDVSDAASWSQSYVLLHDCLTFLPQWKKKPILLVLNKVDIADEMTIKTCERMLRLETLTQIPQEDGEGQDPLQITILSGCCLSGTSEGKTLAKHTLDWIMSSLK